MGDANNSWRFEIGGRPHELNLDVTMTGKWTVVLDGKVIDEDRKWSFSPEETVDIDGHSARIKVSSALGGLSQQSELFLDGRYVEPLRR
jgi:hypothetical protein